MEPNTGNSIFPGTVTAKTFKGTLSGNASSASSVAWSGVTGKPSTFTPSAHTHNYAGSSSVGGSANSAVKLDTSTAGSATQPVYFSGGKPVACSYTLGKSVPSNAVFTDTDTWRPLGTTANTACAGNDSRLSNSRPASDVYSWAKASTKPSYSWNEISSKPSTFTPSAHTHNTIQDINNNQNVTFAYSKAGMDYGDYTWLAAWNGEELRAVTKGQFATASHTHTKSQITDFPTSLKNPNKLSITVDGGDTGATSANAYDGSSAESISVSSSTHNHDLTYLKLTGGTLTGTLSSKLEPYGTTDQYIAHLGAYFSASTTENCYGGSLSIISTLKYTGIRIGYFKSSGQRATLSGGVNFHHNQDKSFGVTISGTTYYSPYIKLTTKLINQNGYYFDADYGFVMRLYNFVPIGNKNTECSIGDSTDKWKFIYATNGTIQTSNELKKNIIKDGIDNRYEELYEKLEPIAFTWNNETADGNTHDRVHLGLGAQTTKKHMDEVGITAEEYALYCEDNIKDEEGNDTGEKEYGINYGQLHALHIHMIQKLLAKVDELETRLMEFENK